MNRLFATIPVAILLALSANAKHPVSLFDGKTLNGWIQIPTNSWEVKAGVIASLGKGRGVLYTTNQYDRYRLMPTARHLNGKPDHKPGVLFFCTAPTEGQKPADALGGIQFQMPTGGHCDYRKGHNNSGDGFAPFPRGAANFHEWSRVELLVDAKTGTARVAVAQPINSEAVEVGVFKDPTAGKLGRSPCKCTTPVCLTSIRISRLKLTRLSTT